MTQLVQRHTHNPDVMFEGCQVTGRNEPGVAFPTVEPYEGTMMYIGETALYEAIATFMQITVDEAKARMEARPTPKQAELNATIKRIEVLEAVVARWERFRNEMEANGLTLNIEE